MESLAAFIRDNLEAILADWESFARTIGPRSMSVSDLRDDAERMLRFIAADMGTAQTMSEQRTKSEGHALPGPGGADSAAHDHGRQRFAHGFNMNDMVSEYRALRATVIRLWAQKNVTPMQAGMQELVRFNEAIDQTITESIARYTSELDKSRDLFLAALGHDLRTPLGAIVITAEALVRDPSETTRQRGARILRSGRMLANMANDLLDFTRTRMGGKLSLQIGDAQVEHIANGVIEQLRPAYADRTMMLVVDGDTSAQVDAARISQALMNLVLNALQHGDARQPVEISARGRPGEVQIAVHNAGEPIPADRLVHLFEPWTRGDGPGRQNSGLGLYIAREIAQAHGGHISVTFSSQAGTTFTIALPRSTPTPRV